MHITGQCVQIHDCLKVSTEDAEEGHCRQRSRNLKILLFHQHSAISSYFCLYFFCVLLCICIFPVFERSAMADKGWDLKRLLFHRHTLHLFPPLFSALIWFGLIWVVNASVTKLPRPRIFFFLSFCKVKRGEAAMVCLIWVCIWIGSMKFKN